TTDASTNTSAESWPTCETCSRGRGRLGGGDLRPGRTQRGDDAPRPGRSAPGPGGRQGQARAGHSWGGPCCGRVAVGGWARGAGREELGVGAADAGERGEGGPDAGHGLPGLVDHPHGEKATDLKGRPPADGAGLSNAPGAKPVQDLPPNRWVQRRGHGLLL